MGVSMRGTRSADNHDAYRRGDCSSYGFELVHANIDVVIQGSQVDGSVHGSVQGGQKRIPKKGVIGGQGSHRRSMNRLFERHSTVRLFIKNDLP